MYIANTGFGYGDTDSVALSERLMALFAKNLHSDPGSVGEQWASTLQQYFATAGAYDVYDEKVLEETTFYGLPFWHFSNSPSAPSYTLPATTTDPVTGTAVASVSVSPAGLVSTTTASGLTAWSDNGNSSFGLYRPIQPITSREVTTNLPARGVWVTGLVTDDRHGIKPQLGYPTIDLTGHEPAAGRANRSSSRRRRSRSSTPRRSGSSATSSTSPVSSGRTRPARRRAPSGS